MNIKAQTGPAATAPDANAAGALAPAAARPQPQMIPPNIAALEALAHVREATLFQRQATDNMLELMRRAEEPPELHTVVINPGNNGQYTVWDRARFEAKSIGIYNPTSVAVYLGIGGVSATPTSRAPACPPTATLVLPVLTKHLEIGCDPAALAGNTAVVYLFRFLTVQPLLMT